MLAWRRTGLAMAANAILVIRSGMLSGRVGLSLLGMVLASIALALLLTGEARRRQLSVSVAVPRYGMILFTTCGTVLACVAALLTFADGRMWAPGYGGRTLPVVLRHLGDSRGQGVHAQVCAARGGARILVAERATDP